MTLLLLVAMLEIMLAAYQWSAWINWKQLLKQGDNAMFFQVMGHPNVAAAVNKVAAQSGLDVMAIIVAILPHITELIQDWKDIDAMIQKILAWVKPPAPPA